MRAGSQKFILVTVDSHQFVLPLVDSHNFFQVKHIAPIPQTDDRIAGLVYHDGHMVTVLDTVKILKLSSSKKNEQCVMVGCNQHCYGWLIAAAGELVEAKRILTDKKKAILSKYILVNKKKIYILDIAEALKELDLHDK
jgi:chemotaxis signal transduction protein